MNMFLSMRDTFGGSTITQQLIKNLTHEDDITVQRKLQEIFRAIEFERHWSKEEIIEMYLNVVYFGHGRFGIGAAAHFYFGKSVSELTLAESAAIIGITNNPSRFSPYANRRANKERQELILRRMHELGYIDEQELRRSINEELNFQRGEDEVFQRVVYTWFEETIIRDVIRDLQIMKEYSEQWARRRLYTGGLRIISTIDLNMQAIVDEIYQNVENLPRVTGSTQPLQSAIIVADPYTGAVRALSGGTGRKTHNMLFNRATQSRRPPGSALKPLSIYAPALEFGHVTPNSRYLDSDSITLSGTTWRPRNADRTHRGVVDVRTALRLSLNTVPAVILDEIGIPVGFSFLRDAMGFTLNPADEDYAPLSMGQLTNGATVREMTSGFTTFPNQGERVELRTYSRIYLPNGEIYLDNEPRSIRIMQPNAANMMTSMLVDAVTNGTGGAAIIGGGMPVAGKTGTSTDSMDRWFVGYTPHLIAGVWTGFDTPARMSSQGNPAAHIFRMVMQPIHADLETRQFTTPTAPGPVAGGLQIGSYTLRLVDVMGNTITTLTRDGVLGRTVTVSAPPLDYYVIVGDTSKTMTISSDPSRNVAVFVYRWIGRDAPETPAPETPDDQTPPTEQPSVPEEPTTQPADQPPAQPEQPPESLVEQPEPPPVESPPVLIDPAQDASDPDD
jgi:penicillin-binding protein 1A